MEKSIESTYEAWLSGQKSEQTRRTYKGQLDRFLKLVFDKTIDELVGEDFSDKSFYPDLVQSKYIEVMRDNGNKDASIQTGFMVVSSFMKELERNRVLPDVDFHYIRKYVLDRKKLDKDGGHVSPMSVTDFEKFTKYVSERHYRTNTDRLGDKYAGLAKFLYTTAIRISATFRIKWCDIMKDEDVTGNIVPVIHVVDNRRKHNTKPISSAYLQELKSLYYTGDDNDTIFHEISQSFFSCLMTEFSNKIGREITPHSFKVGAAMMLFSKTKDIRLVSEFMDHNDISTTMLYIHGTGSFKDEGSYILSTPVSDLKASEMDPEIVMNIIEQSLGVKFLSVRSESEG